ncbi:MAG TPA: ISAs1 family transposase [Synechococcus sp. M44_DOE_062]|nr:ISAs1 family transposase [Synechococcus sp. M44_DOE_062]
MTLLEAIKGIEDPRKARGIRHDLGALILLIISGLLSGYKDLHAISRWGRSLSVTQRELLGFTRATPCCATLSNILRSIGTNTLQKQLNGWLASLCAPGEHLALDGKTLRASHGNPINEQVYLLSLFCQKSGLVLHDTPMQRGENEISCALRLLESVDLAGKTITGDAIFAKKNMRYHRRQGR